jgi:DNA mismatch endonuclease (patch repair protein)
MQANRGADTKPELELRRALHRLGLRFRKHELLEAAGLRTRPDIVFRRAHVAVFVDGCFWHCCPQHATEPKANSAYWSMKLHRNVERDRRIDAALSNAGWRVIRVWEHEPVEIAASRVMSAVVAPKC